MRVIIAGSRTIHDRAKIVTAVQLSKFKITEVVCGMAPGVDMLGYEWARKHQLPIARFPANWKKNGRRAGFLRNVEMVNYADAAILVWDQKSRGTKSTLDLAQRKGIPVYLVRVAL